MAHIQKRTDKDGVSYVARWIDPQGQERAKRFRRKVDAENHLTSVEASKLQGSYADPRLGKTRFEVYCEQWLASTSHEAGTRLNIEGRIRNHIAPAFGPMTLNSIRPQHVRQWVGDLVGKGLAPATTVAAYNTLAKILKTAVIDGYIAKSPCVGIELPRRGKREEMRFLEPEGIEELAHSIDDRYRTLIYMASYTGLRWGELAALRITNLNLLKRSVDVAAAQTEINGNVKIKPFTKTGGRRTVSLPSFLAQMIGEHIGLFPAADDRVFSSAEGTPLRRNFYRRHFKPAVLKTELDPKLRFHDLRHTCAALLIAEGAHPFEIMQRLGHSTIKTTFDRYGHLFPSLDERLREGLEARFQEARNKGQAEEVS